MGNSPILQYRDTEIPKRKVSRWRLGGHPGVSSTKMEERIVRNQAKHKKVSLC